MRNLERNKETIAYCNFIKVDDVKDQEGNLTGEKKVLYKKAVKIKAHVSGAKGSSMVEVFGTDISYDKVVLLTKNELKTSKIDENTVFFIETPIKYTDYCVPLYDYRVKRIAETVNEVLIAVVKVSANDIG